MAAADTAADALADSVRALVANIDKHERMCAVMRVEPLGTMLTARDRLKAALAQYDATAPAEGTDSE